MTESSISELPRWANTTFLLDGNRYFVEYKNKKDGYEVNYVDANNEEEVRKFLIDKEYCVIGVWIVLRG